MRARSTHEGRVFSTAAADLAIVLQVQAMPPATERRALLAILALAFLIFAPTLAGGFTLDDVFLVQSLDPQGQPDPIIRGMHAPWWYFGQRYWEGTNSTTTLYRPLTILSFALTYNLIAAPFLAASAEAFPHHLVNVLLHVLAVWLVFRWLRGVGVVALPALAAAGAFAAFGVHSEAVAGIVGRAELLSVVFGLGALVLFSRQRIGLAGMALFAAFCAKESALAWAPFLVCHLLAQRWLAGAPASLGSVLRQDGRRLALAVLPALGVYLALRGFATAGVAETTILYQENPLAFVDLGTRLHTAVMLQGFGLLSTALPGTLTSVYGPGSFTPVTTATDPRFLGALATLGVWLAAGLIWRRRSPLLFLSATAFLGLAFITSNIPFAIGTIYAERLWYAPSLGVAVLFALLLAAPALARWRQPIGMAVLALCVSHATVILMRNGAWRDNATLLIGDAERTPRSAELQLKAAAVLANTDTTRALRFLERALAADPELPTAYGLRARIQQVLGNPAAAEADFRRALACRYASASGEDARAASDLLTMMMSQGRLRDADLLVRELLERLPDLLIVRLAQVDLALGRVPPAEYDRLLSEAQRRHPRDPRLHLRRATFDYEQGRGLIHDPAAQANAFLTVLRTVPANELTQINGLRARVYLAETLLRGGRKDDARRGIEDLLTVPNLPADVRRRADAVAAGLR